jgi:hypothetical protein
LAAAQADPAAPANSAAPPAAQAGDDDPDRDFNRSQPDFTVVNLPTTLRLPKFKSAFRVTHRFGRPLGQGDFGELAEDLFGLDSGARIGLEYRFGLMRGLQVGITAPATARSSSSRSTACCSRRTTASAWASSRRSTARTTSRTATRR